MVCTCALALRPTLTIPGHRKELLEAAAAATAEAAAAQQEGAAAVAAAEAQPVILVTNDNAQLQLAKSHGLPAFKLAGDGGRWRNCDCQAIRERCRRSKL